MLYNKIKKYLSDNNINIKDVEYYFTIKDLSNKQGPFIDSWDSNSIGISQPTKKQLDSINEKKLKLEKLKEAKILEAKAKREEKLSNFVVDEGIIEAKNRAETVLILEGYKKMLDQNITLAEYGLKDGKLIKLTKPIIDKWLLSISSQVNQAWLDYRAIEKKINNAKTLSTLNKIEIK